MINRCGILVNRYFEWMCKLIYDKKYLNYQTLLQYLHTIDFKYIIDMDANRAEDGVDLRYRYAYDHNYKDAIIADCLDGKPCSVLEMLVALAIRCEDHIMEDLEIGNRTGQWFWTMIDNLGLSRMSDTYFDKAYTDEIIYKFLYREYDRNGVGGLFPINNCKQDMRNVDIWYQMCWYLGGMLGGR